MKFQVVCSSLSPSRLGWQRGVKHEAPHFFRGVDFAGKGVFHELLGHVLVIPNDKKKIRSMSKTTN